MSISNVKEYKRYFGDFRGVDFSSDETQVSDRRFARAVNVYKDYQTSNGNGIETIPGFRKRIEAPNGKPVFGIHTFNRYDENGDGRIILIHAGNALYYWDNFGDEENESLLSVYVGMNERESKSFVFNNRLYIMDGANYLVYDGLKIQNVKDEAYIPTTYINIIPAGENADIGTEYEQRNILSPYFKSTFIITKYKDENGTEKISKDFQLNEKFDDIKEVKLYGQNITNFSYSKNSGVVTILSDIKLPENTPMLDADGNPLKDNEGNTINYPEMYAGVEITAERRIYDARDIKIKKTDGSFVTYTAYKDDDAFYTGEGGAFLSLVEKATVVSVFDNRVFFSGFPGKPNLIFYSARNDAGHNDPSYIGVLNYMQDGVGDAPITAMIPIANALLVLKAHTEHESAVYYHTPTETGFDIIPKVYPYESGLAGTGCVGAAINFLDDPVFVSELGLEAIGQLSVRNERAREHRSSLVDSVLVNKKDLSNAKLCEWNGYLLVLVGDSIFMADSRQTYQSNSGDMEYEWYYLEDIGVYEGQTEKYLFLQAYPKVLADDTTEDGRTPIFVQYNGIDIPVGIVSDVEETYEMDSVLEIKQETVTVGDVSYIVDVAIFEDSRGLPIAFLCETVGEMHGGTLRTATSIVSFSHNGVSNVYFGTENGVVCSFNFDKRSTDDGLIDSRWYTFNERSILSGISLSMDNCGYPDTTKTTIKKSLVIKARSMTKVSAKINVRTNRSHSYVGDIASNFGIRGLFSNMNFQDFTFLINDMPMFSLNEKEKKWVEKQYSIYSDMYCRPFSLVYLMYRYRLVGKFKG